VDFHAEATSEKITMGFYLDGKVSAVLGTHTHVTTSDEQILPNGTGYITDAGMTGPYNSVIGVKKEAAMTRIIHHLPARFDAADGPCSINAVLLEIDENSGKCIKIERICIK
jgi:calcineurin-like phosphoesterase